MRDKKPSSPLDNIIRREIDKLIKSGESYYGCALRIGCDQSSLMRVLRHERVLTVATAIEWIEALGLRVKIDTEPILPK